MDKLSALDTLSQAVLKEVPKFVSSLILLWLAWVVTQRVSEFWSLRQKKKEYDLLTARDFHMLYGEFFAVWKLWNYYIRDIGVDHLLNASRWSLLDRACTAEGKLESMLVRLVCDKELKSPDIEILGQFRQLYQELRQCIRHNTALPWDYAEHPHYVAFKQRAPKIAALIERNKQGKLTALLHHIGIGRNNVVPDALFDITSNEHEVWRNNLFAEKAP